MDTFTKYLTLAVDILFLKQPMRTSLGLFLGLATKSILKILAIWISVAQAILSANLAEWEYGLLGILLVHIPTAGHYLFAKVGYLSESEERAFSMIRELKLPEYQKQQMYLKVVEKVLDRVELKTEAEKETVS